jgi:hypothetical protein
MVSPVGSQKCACPKCTCDAAPDSKFTRNEEAYCSLACADQHPAGAPCPDAACHCEEVSQEQQTGVSEPQLDEAVEETFPASDPISP